MLRPGDSSWLPMAKDTLSVTDNRTGQTFEVPITDGTVPAMAFREMKVSDDDFGLMTYDPAFMNTAACRSAITYIDGAKGVLNYRGYSIEELAASSSFLEVAYLLLNGDLPNSSELADWTNEITHHTFLHENLKDFMNGFRYDAHPMSMLVSTVGGLSSFYPEAREISDPAARRRQIVRLIAKMPTLAAWSLRHRQGLPYVYPKNDLSYAGNFLAMINQMSESKYEVHPILERAMDVLFILHADHEQNCSTTTMRAVGSAQADPFEAIAAAASALAGPLHGGANEKVLRMLREIGDKNNVTEYVDSVKRGEKRLMGFGHRVYKSYDPRAAAIKDLAEQVFDVTGKNPLLEIAQELEKIALEDEYFISRSLYPNVDFYSGLIYDSMGFNSEFFTVLFAIPRTAGWLAQWDEMLEDKSQRIARPRQIYIGPDARKYVPVDQR